MSMPREVCTSIIKLIINVRCHDTGRSVREPDGLLILRSDDAGVSVIIAYNPGENCRDILLEGFRERSIDSKCHPD